MPIKENICVCVYIYTHMNVSQAAVQLAQQWPTMNGKPKNPAVAQSTRLGHLSWSSVHARIPKK